MRTSAVLLGFLFGGIAFAVDAQAGAVSGATVSFIAIVGAFATMLHPRAGFVLFAIAIAISALNALQEPTMLVYAMMFAIPAALAYRSAQRNKLAAERAERADRFYRQQTGE